MASVIVRKWFLGDDQRVNQWSWLLYKYLESSLHLFVGAGQDRRTAAVVVAVRSRLSPQRGPIIETHASQLPRYLNSLIVRHTGKYWDTYASPSALDTHCSRIGIIHIYVMFIWVRRHGSFLPPSSKTAKMATIITWPRILWRTCNVKGTKRPVAFVIYCHVIGYTCTSNGRPSQE